VLCAIPAAAERQGQQAELEQLAKTVYLAVQVQLAPAIQQQQQQQQHPMLQPQQLVMLSSAFVKLEKHCNCISGNDCSNAVNYSSNTLNSAATATTPMAYEVSAPEFLLSSLHPDLPAAAAAAAAAHRCFAARSSRYSLLLHSCVRGAAASCNVAAAADCSAAAAASDEQTPAGLPAAGVGLAAVKAAGP